MEVPHAADSPPVATLRAVGDLAGRVGAQRLAALPSPATAASRTGGAGPWSDGHRRDCGKPAGCGNPRASPLPAPAETECLTTRSDWHGIRTPRHTRRPHPRVGRDQWPPITGPPYLAVCPESEPAKPTPLPCRPHSGSLGRPGQRRLSGASTGTRRQFRRRRPPEPAARRGPGRTPTSGRTRPDGE